MFFSIDAVDTMFFRSSVPFETGGDTYMIGSLFPPLPSVYAGALRPFIRPKKEGESKPRIKIGFNGVALDGNICFPMPLDYMCAEKCDDSYKLSMLSLQKNDASSYPLKYYLSAKDGQQGKTPVIKGGGYISKASLDAYLRGEDTEQDCIALGKYFSNEPKIGIKIDKESGAVVQGALYEIQQVRPSSSLKLVVQAEGVVIEEKTLITLGGESRVSVIQPFIDQMPIAAGRDDRRMFKLYLATPAIFKNGWLPGWIDSDDNYTGVFKYKKKQVKVRLACAAIGRHIGVGGFGYGYEPNAKKKMDLPKELRYAVPAGSVYYFDLLEGSFDDATALFHQKCVSEYREGDYKAGWWGFERPAQEFNRLRYCDRGFGYAMVGKISEEQGELI